MDAILSAIISDEMLLNAIIYAIIMGKFEVLGVFYPKDYYQIFISKGFTVCSTAYDGFITRSSIKNNLEGYHLYIDLSNCIIRLTLRVIYW